MVQLRQSLEDKDRMKIDIRVIYGKNELQPAQINWLRSLKFVRTSFCENLHAKCYLNEREAIITSMNLYEFSQVNNHEMGIYITKSDDPDLYEAIYAEARRLIRISEEIRVSIEVVPPDSPFSNGDEKGFCIRCKKEIVRNPAAPYCGDCYRVWKKYENPTYQEKYCHRCGKDHPSTMHKPLCPECYRQQSKKPAIKGKSA